MDYAEYRFTLDVNKAGSQVLLNCRKGDLKKRVLIKLVQDGRAYNIGSECTCVFTAKKPDGTILYNSCTLSDNTIQYDFTAQTAAAVGTLDCQMRVYGAGHDPSATPPVYGALICSPNFTVVVNDTVYSDGDVISSSSEYSALTVLVNQAGSAISAANAAASSATSAAAEARGIADSKVNKPSTEGTNGQVLATNGEGGTYWKNSGGGGGGTSDFNELENRPKYNSSLMNNTTNIPEVKSATWDAKYDKPSSGIPDSDIASATTWNAKQNAINSSNKLPASYVSGLASVATSGSYNDLSNRPTIPVVPTNVSAFTNDAGYLTEHQSLSAYRTSVAQDVIDAGKVNEPSSEGTDGQVLATDGSGTRYWKTVSGGGGGTSDFEALEHRPKYNSATMDRNTNIPQVKTSVWDAKYDKPAGGIPASDLAQSYYLASNPSGFTDDTVANSKYTKPAGGIPDSDIASASTWNGKQNAISDLETIRSNASAGAAKVSCTDATVGGFGYTKNTGTVSSLSDMNITATAGELNVLDGITASTTELNYCDGVTGNIQTQINGKANSSHTHTKSQITDFPTNVSSFTNDAGYLTAHQDISGKENISNKVTSLSAASTDTQYPSAKCVYDIIGNVESLLLALR